MGNNHENNTEQQFDFSLLCEYFLSVDRQGPGSGASTLRALGFIDGLTAQSRIADLGCGTGASALLLARHTGAHVTALDLFPAFLEKLRQRAVETGLADRIDTVEGSMDNPPFGDETFDVLWSEGAIYNIGFVHGLELWRRYLKRGGYVAVTEISWLTDERPAEIAQFWNEAYPEIDTMGHKLEQLQQCGYRPVAAFVLPDDCWTTHYYEPQREARRMFFGKHCGNATAEQLMRDQRHEAQLYERYKTQIGRAHV